MFSNGERVDPSILHTSVHTTIGQVVAEAGDTKRNVQQSELMLYIFFRFNIKKRSNAEECFITPLPGGNATADTFTCANEVKIVTNSDEDL